MATADLLKSFEQANPAVEFLTPSAPAWDEKRATRGHVGEECTPLGIAVPKDASQVADVVRWATKSGVDFSVRSGGNDFFGRFVVDGGLMIDVRNLNSIVVAEDKKTATIGGGVISKDLIEALESEGLVAPLGNVWVVGYVGWATLGGYGPFTNLHGLGLEAIVGAEVVNAQGEVVKATDDMLEGIRGMGGNLGVITSLTIRTHPSQKLLSGMMLFDATPDSIKAVMAAEERFDIPKCLTLHHFIMTIKGQKIAVFFNWEDADLDKGKQCLESFLAIMPPVKMSTVGHKTLTEHYAGLPVHLPRWGGQRSLYVKDMSPGIVDILLEAMEGMPNDVNIGWTMPTKFDATTLPNCFGGDSAINLSFTDMAHEEKDYAPAKEWANALYARLRASGDGALLDGSYPPLTPTADRTAAQMFGDKWARAKELKNKYDPENVFKFAVPRM